MLTKGQKRKIINYIKDEPVEVVYAFGSRATRSHNSLSDYDFGVVFSPRLDSHERFETRLKIIGFLTGLLKTDKLDVLDLGYSPIRFQYEAIKPREEIYVRNKRIRDSFEYEVLTNYLDQMHFMKQTARDTLHRVATFGFRTS